MKRLATILTAFITVLVPAIASAAGLQVWCFGLAGCGSSGYTGIPSLFLAAVTLPGIIAILVTVATGVSMAFIVYGGLQMVFIYWDEGRTTKARQTVINAVEGFALTMVSATIVYFVTTQITVDQAIINPNTVIMNTISVAIASMMVVFNSLFGLAVVVAGVRMALAQGKSDEFQKGTNMIKWAIIGAIVVNVARALIGIIAGLGL